MGLTSALSAAMSGLRVNQAALEVTAGNIANASSPGYTRKTLPTAPIESGGRTTGVSAGTIQRHLDLQVQSQYRLQVAGQQSAALMADYLDRLDRLFGTPGGTTSLDVMFGKLTGSFEALAASPESPAARMEAVGSAAALAGQLNALSANVQNMRQEAEAGIAASVREANDALQAIQRVNERIVAEQATGGVSAALLDERDRHVDTLATLMDIKTRQAGDGSIVVTTDYGMTLLDREAATLSFDERPGLTPEAAWSSDPAARGVGTLMLTLPGGQKVDLFASGSIGSGTIAGYRALRDDVLPEAQAELDALADRLARALSGETVPGSAVSVAGADGFEVDLAGLLAGNVVTLDTVATPAGTAERISFVRVDDPSALPLGDDATADPADRVVGIDFSGGMAAVAAQMQAALGPGFTVSNPAGGSIRILDDGAAGTTDIAGLSAERTVTALADDGLALPVFVDAAGQPYSASLDGGVQRTGFAGRIAVNATLAADPSRMVLYGSGVASGDSARPTALLDRLTEAAYAFPADTGIGSAATPFKGTMGDYVRQMLAYRGAAAETAAGREASQTMTVQTLTERLSASSAVSIDEEMAHLVEIQNAYAANARVMSTVREMLDLLMKL